MQRRVTQETCSTQKGLSHQKDFNKEATELTVTIIPLHNPPIHPSCSYPVDLVPDSAVLHLLHLYIGQTLLTAVAALASSLPRAAFLAHYSGILERLFELGFFKFTN